MGFALNSQSIIDDKNQSSTTPQCKKLSSNKIKQADKGKKMKNKQAIEESILGIKIYFVHCALNSI